MRTLIVDDERLAREELRAMLAVHPEVDVVGEAADASQAEALIAELAPDLVFLDVQMPGRSGFDLLEQVTPSFRTVFVTAFDEYALRAFEVNALDYLLKPVSAERLARALARVSSEAHPEAIQRPLDYNDPVLLTVDGRPRLVRISTIASIVSAGDYSEIFASDGTRLFVLKSLKDWEHRLPPAQFARIHRSTIVNLEHMLEIEEWSNRSYRVAVRGVRERLVVSRRYAARLRERFG